MDKKKTEGRKDDTGKLRMSLIPPHDCMAKGRFVWGSRQGNAKLTDEQAVAIFLDCRTQRKIAEEYGIKQTTVWNIKIGKTYRHHPEMDGRYKPEAVDK